VPNYKMAKPGHHFSEGGINLSWGVGRDASDVISVPLAGQPARFAQRVLAGVIVETKDPVTAPEGLADVREYRLLTGEEARAHKAQPAGVVTRSVFNPVSGELMNVEIGSTKIVPEPDETPSIVTDDEGDADDSGESGEAGEAEPGGEPSDGEEEEPADPAEATT